MSNQENFNRIESMIESRQESVNLYNIVNNFELSVTAAKILLNDFVNNNNAIDKYIVIFTASYLDEKSAIKTSLFPSFSFELRQVVENSEILDFSVFAVHKKSSNFATKDYSMFCHEINSDIVDLFSNIQIISTPNSESKSKGTQIKAKNSTNVETNQAKTTKNETNSNKTNNIIDKNPKKDLNLAKNNKKTAQSTLKTEAIKPTVIESSYTMLDSNTKFAEDGECYYGGEAPKKELSKILETDMAIKRKKSEEITESQTNNKLKQSKQASQVNIENSQDTNINEAPKKVLKTRRIKRTNTYKNEKGYLVTQDEWEDEEYWTDEKRKPIIQEAPIIDNKKKANGNKKQAAGQSSLHNFFNK